MTDDEQYEQQNEPQNYPSITQAIFLALRFLLYSVVLGIAVALIPAKFNLPQHKSLNAFVMMISYVAAIVVAIYVGAVKFRKNEQVKFALKFNKAPVLAVLVSICIILTMPVLTDPISTLIPMSDAWKKIFEDMSDNNIWSLFAVVIAAPILEEIFFRGIILNGLLKNYSPQTAIITSAAIFGLIHLNPWQAIPAFLGGLLMGWMYWKTNSIIPGMILHFANNLFSTLLGLAFKDADTIKQLVSTPVYIALYLFCAAVLMGGWYFLELYFEKNPTPDDGDNWEPELASAEDE